MTFSSRGGLFPTKCLHYTTNNFPPRSVPPEFFKAALKAAPNFFRISRGPDKSGEKELRCFLFMKKNVLFFTNCKMFLSRKSSDSPNYATNFPLIISPKNQISSKKRVHYTSFQHFELSSHFLPYQLPSVVFCPNINFTQNTVL